MITDTEKSSQLSNNRNQDFKSNLVKISDNLFNCKIIVK